MKKIGSIKRDNVILSAHIFTVRSHSKIKTYVNIFDKDFVTLGYYYDDIMVTVDIEWSNHIGDRKDYSIAILKKVHVSQDEYFDCCSNVKNYHVKKFRIERKIKKSLRIKYEKSSIMS
jgi:hypothetical protein